MWRKRGNENHFACSRNGDHLVTPFQCDLCIFWVLKGCDPIHASHQDKYLEVLIWQMILDSLWRSEPNTIAKHRSQIKLGLEALETTGVHPLYPRLGPLPIKDTMGYTVAVQMLEKLRAPGNKGQMYQQFHTIWQLQLAFLGVYKISVQGLAEGAMYGTGRNQAVFTQCPTETPWFCMFYCGCEK